MPRIIVLITTFVSFLIQLMSCSTFPSEPYVPGTIYAKWEYKACSFKNTSVKGYLDFRRDGTFVIKLKVREDFPGKTISGTYPFSLEGNRIVTSYDKGSGMAEYFLIEGDSLYLSREPITKAIVPEDPRLGANWSYRLERVK